jgi:hypothetical protein
MIIPLLLLPAISAYGQSFTWHKLIATEVTFKGKSAYHLKAASSADPAAEEHLAILPGTEGFSNGTIEVDVTGEPAPGVGGGARGFVGVAFRVQPDRKTYDCFYVRPTNGRADDQERRNHSVQYISHPQFTWSKLRQETPSRYEAYADMQPREWIHLKIEVNGDKARFYVNGAVQPTLIVNDVKSGATAKGSVAIWLEGTTVGHFSGLRVTPGSLPSPQ